MKKKRTSLIVVLLISSLVIYNFETIVHAFTYNNAIWFQRNIEFVVDTSIGSSIYAVKKPDDMSIFTNAYQNAIDKKIDTLVKQQDEAILLYNPYGTNTSSFYFTCKSDTAYTIQYSIHVDDQNISDYTQTAKTNQIDDGVYAYQFIGFVYGESNTLTIRYQVDGVTTKEESYTIQMPKAANESNTTLTKSEGTSSKTLSNGLYAVFGLDKSFQSNIYLYDNDGILRSEYVLKNYRSDKIVFLEDELLYSYKKNGFIRVNSLGKITAIYDFDGYSQHHDFLYDEKTNSLLILANEDDQDTIEDVIITLNLDNAEVTKLIDMKDLLPTLYEQALSPEEGNTYGGYELDWIHLNSLSLVDDELIVSSREVSTIIKISNIYTKPTIDYMIADSSLYKGDEELQSLLLNKTGDFISQAGQHAVFYEEDDSLIDGQYYLTMYNNNFTSSRTRQDLDWSAFENAGTYTKGSASYYYKYLIDENNNTYSLIEQISLPYSSIVSNIQDYAQHLISSSGMSHCFNEYDAEGTMIAQFDYNAEKYAYRIFKYDFAHLYFE